MIRTAWNKGKKWTETTKKRISESRRGITAWNKGKSWSIDVVEKIKKSRKGQPAWNKGKKWPQAVKKKISRSKLALTADLKPFYERNAPSKRFRFQVFNRDGFKCQYCGRSAKETVLEVDRKIPGSKGGKYTLDNSITSCIDCNRGKSDQKI